ncbi:MAG: hypothetical protein HZC28_18715 [Spirochaetes bacterium]|nr:hypothetical protein [Spirochaetota bacterium]
MKRICFSALLCAAVSAFMLSAVGTTAVRELAVDDVTSARDAAMGGASESIIDDPNAIYINPALMPMIMRSGISFSADYTAFGGYRGTAALTVRDAENAWAFGLGAKGDYTVGVGQYSDTDVHTGNFNYGSFTGIAGAAFDLNDNYIGASVKYYHTLLDATESAWGVALNAAFSRSLFIKSLQLAVVLRNLGVYYHNTLFDLDSRIIVGLGFKSEGKFAVGLTFSYALPSSDVDFALGGEYKVVSFNGKPASNEDPISQGVFIRAGLNKTAPSIGAGIAFWHVRIDYALYTDSYSLTGLNHTVGVDVLF